jgi:folate-binding protein YgfZ
VEIARLKLKGGNKLTELTGNRILETPLAAHHATSGAKMGEWFGCSLPDDFGDPAAEFRAARDSAAMIDKSYRAYLSFTGPDRVRYLNAILTNNIKELVPGHGNVSLLLNAQGHIIAEIETYAELEKLFCVSYALIRESLVAWLDKYIIMDDVTLADDSARFATLALEGPKTATIVRELFAIDLASLGELEFLDAASSPIPVRLVRRSPGGIAGAEFLVERENVLAFWQLLERAARKHGGRPVGYSALSAMRLMQGVPWFSYDFGEKQIPHEAGLENSHISYTKGCYTGQEIVERVRSRGQVNRRRVLLSFTGNSVPEAGAILTATDGTEAGYVTRAARAWDPDRIIGIGYVRKSSNAAGTVLQWPGGTATVASA